MLDVEFHELLVAAEKFRCEAKAANRLRASRRVEFIISRVERKARPNSSEPDWLSVALNLFQRYALAIRVIRNAGKVENANALEAVSHIDDEVRRQAAFSLDGCRVAVCSEI